MALTQEQVTLITVAALGKAPGADHLNYFTNSATASEFLVNGGTTNINTLLPYETDLEAVAAVLEHERKFLEAKNGLAPQTDEEFVASVVANLGAADGASLAAALASGTPRYKALVEFALAEEANGPIANVTNATGSLDDVEQDLIDTGTPANPSVPGETLSLTAGNDGINATSIDTVDANVVQNDLGLLVNSLGTGDVINGAGTLEATLINDANWASVGVGGTPFDPRPVMNNVDTVKITALEDVTLDASATTGTNQWWSVGSRDNLTINNVSIAAEQITHDITIGMESTWQSADLEVYFDQRSLRRAPEETESSARFFIEIADASENVDPDAPLANIRIFELTFPSDDGPVVLSNIESTDDSYEGLQEAVQNALDEQGLGGRYEASLGATFTELNNNALSYTGRQIIIEDTSENAPTIEREDVSLVVAGKAGIGQGVFLQNRDTDFDSVTTQFKVTSDIILDWVGRGSEGGNLTVGGMSNSAASRGVQVFDIEVRNHSNVDNFYSTRGSLEELHITNGAGYSGNLTLRNSDSGDNDTINGGDLIKAEGFSGNLTLGSAANRLDNVTELDAAISGNVSYWANMSARDNYEITTGNGNDRVDVTLQANTVDHLGTGLDITTGNGQNTVNVNTIGNVASYNTMETLQNLSISTGRNDDTITVTGRGTFDIDAGAGDDFVNIAGGDTGTWTFGVDSPSDITAFNTFMGGDARVLYNATLTVSFAGFEAEATVATDRNGNFLADQSTINAAIRDAITGDDTLSQLLRVTGSNDGQLTVRSVVGGDNQLAIDLFQPELVGSDADAGQLVVSAAADISALRAGLLATTTNDSDDLDGGAAVLTEFNSEGYGSISMDGTGDSTHEYNIAARDAEANAYMDFAANGAANGGTINFSSINPGTGDDVVVFQSNVASSNTLVLEGRFDNVKVVNFHNVDAANVTDAADVGIHALDFTSYLTGRTSTSGSEGSAQPADIVLNIPASSLAGNNADHNDNDARANSVNVLLFDETVHDDSLSFANVTLNNLVAQLNDEDSVANEFGGLDGDSLTAVDAPTDFLGTTQNHIVMVENVQNPGEYKVFHLRSTVNNDGDIQNDGAFTGVAMLGTLDFGASINFALAGNSDYEVLREALIDHVTKTPDVAFTFNAAGNKYNNITINPLTGDVEDGGDNEEPEDAVFTATGDIAVAVDTAESFVATVEGIDATGVDESDSVTLEVTIAGGSTETITFITGDTGGAWTADLSSATSINSATLEGDVENLTAVVTGEAGVEFAVTGFAGDNVTEDATLNVAAVGQDDATYEATAVTIDLAAGTWDPEAPAELEAGYIFKLTVGGAAGDVIAEYTVEADDTLVEVAAGLIADTTYTTNYTVAAVTGEASQVEVEVDVDDASQLDSDANITITLTGMSAADWDAL